MPHTGRIQGITTLLLALLAPMTLNAEETKEISFRPRGPVEITAHRGASYYAPENTLAAFRLGWEQKADSVELDVYLTRDGRIVCFHDRDTKRVAGVERPVVEQTLEELRRLDVGTWKGEQWQGEPIPTLAEALETLPRWGRMFVEIKCGPEITPEMVRVVEAAGKRADQIVFISFSLEACASIKKALPAHEVYYLSSFKQNEDTGAWTPTVETLIAQAREAGLDGLNVNYGGPLDKGFARQVREAGLKFCVWTVNAPEDALRMARIGAMGITTDRPAFIRETLEKAGQ